MKLSPINTSAREASFWHSPALKITLIYAVVAGLWILLSDALVHQFIANPDEVENLSMIKGLAFVAVTGVLLFGLIQGWFSRILKTKAELRESEERYRSLLMLSPDAIYLHTEGRLTLANSALCRLLGAKDAAELIGRPALDIVHPDFHDLARECWQELSSGQPVQANEIKFVRLDGSVVEVEVSAVMVISAGRSEIQVIAREITERKQTEAALRESREHFVSLFQKAPLGYQSLDADGRFLEVNEAWLTTLGYRREEVIGKWFGDFLAPEFVDAFRERFPRFKAAGQIHTEFQMLHREGGRRFIAFDGRIGHHQDGGFEKTHCILRDITELKQAESLLLQERELYLDLVNTQPAGIYRLRVFPKAQRQPAAWGDSRHAPYSMELASDRFCEIIGFTRQAFETNPAIVNDLVHPDDRAEFARINEEANVRLIAFRWEGRLVVDGKIRWVHFESLPRPVANGDVLWTGIVYDITERKQAEAALRESEFFFKESQRVARIGSYACDFISGRWTSSDVLDQIFGMGQDSRRNIQAWLALVHPEDRPAMEQHLRAEVMANRQPFNKEYRIVRPTDGEIRWVHGLGEVACDSAGHAISMLGTIQDITERKRVEMALRESEERFRRAVVDSPFPIMIHAEDGKVIQVSQSWCDLTGYTREELATVGDWTERAYGERKTLLQAGIDRLYGLEKRENEGDYVIRTQSGATRIWDFSSGPLGRLPDGRRLAISMALDVTERREAETKLKEKMAALERFNHLTVDRELRMVQLKQEINALLKQTGQPEKYRIVGEP